MPKAGGKWNTFEITARGRDITVVLNGNKTAELRNGMFDEGWIALQHGAGAIRELLRAARGRHRVSANASEPSRPSSSPCFVVNTNWQPTASALSSAEPRYAPERLPPRRPTLGRI